MRKSKQTSKQKNNKKRKQTQRELKRNKRKESSESFSLIVKDLIWLSFWKNNQKLIIGKMARIQTRVYRIPNGLYLDNQNRTPCNRAQSNLLKISKIYMEICIEMGLSN